MSKLLIVLMAATMLITGNAYAEDNGGLPEIAAYDDEAYDLLPDAVSANDMVADASDAMPASDDGSMPEIAAYDDEAFEALPDMVSAQ
jgi:hypothetical protein